MVVSDTSPLVYLAALGDFQLLRDLFIRLVIPTAVLDEIAAGGDKLPVAAAVREAMDSWLFVHPVAGTSGVDRLRQAGLHTGESEAIVLATELHSHALLMDDSDGVRAAAPNVGTIIRTPGIYRMAKENQLISAVRPRLDQLRKAGFWLREEHYRMILETLDE